MKVKVDKDLCIGCGACISICPNVFSFNDDGYSEVIEEDIKNGNVEEVKDAIESCPTEAISKTEDEDEDEKK